MGYPMTWARLVGRNDLGGDYGEVLDAKSMIRGDMRRLERDSLDDHHLEFYANRAGITPEQARALLLEFFGIHQLTMPPSKPKP